jgi:hypothetical protein
MGGGGSIASTSTGIYTQCPTTSPRSIEIGLVPTYSHGGAGGGCSEAPTGNTGSVYSASRVGGGALGYYAYANSGTAATEELLLKGSSPFLVRPSYMQQLCYVATFMYDCVVLTVL